MTAATGKAGRFRFDHRADSLPGWNQIDHLPKERILRRVVLGDHIVDLSRFLLQDAVTVEVRPQQAVPPPLAAIEDAAVVDVLCLSQIPITST